LPPPRTSARTSTSCANRSRRDKVGVATVGKCKGTLEAAKSVDMIVIFHVPLFSKWLKEVMDRGVRVLMIIDAPDDLDLLMSPRGLKEAMQYAHRKYEKTREAR
jgi:2,5-dihydroxypyridine 5,6-dioxygenase